MQTIKITEYAFGLTRTPVVQALAKALGVASKYQGAPSFAYKVGSLSFSKASELTFDENTTTEAFEVTKKVLTGLGCEFEVEGNILVTEEPKTELPTDAEQTSTEGNTLVVEMPNDLTEAQLDNLNKLILSKENLLLKALGTESLSLEVTPEKISFPWFHINGTEGEGIAYAQLTSALVKMAKESKRITAKPKDVPNEKYAFRCFLLRLGFIGDEYKVARKILMANLDGNTAWRNGGKKDEAQATKPNADC